MPRLTPLQALQAITKGKWFRLYLFNGIEEHWRERLTRALKGQVVERGTEAFNVVHLAEEELSLRAALSQAHTVAMGSGGRLVVFQDPSFLQGKGSKRDEEALSRFSQGSGRACLVLWAEEAQSRKKRMLRLIEENGCLVEGGPLKPAERTAWLERVARRKGVQLEPGASALLVQRARDDLTLLMSELEKLATYSPDGIHITKADVLRLVPSQREERVFDYLDAVGEGRLADSVAILRQLVQQGEPIPLILYMLARQIRIILQLKLAEREGINPQDLRSTLAIHPYVMQKATKQGRNYTIASLEASLSWLLETDLAIKTGQWPDRLALEVLTARLID